MEKMKTIRRIFKTTAFVNCYIYSFYIRYGAERPRERHPFILEMRENEIILHCPSAYLGYPLNLLFSSKIQSLKNLRSSSLQTSQP